MQVATAQINARIDPQLKSRGDKALASAGFTPTQAVRSLWEFADRHASSPEDIARLLRPAQEEGGVRTSETERESLLRLADESAGLFEQRMKQAGVDPELFSSLDVPFEQLEKRAWDAAEQEGAFA